MMSLSYLFLCFCLFLIAFSMFRNQLMSNLIILEGLMLISIVFSILSVADLGSKSLVLLLLTFAAIEAALGLALLVNFLRSYGNDFCINMSQFFAKN